MARVIAVVLGTLILLSTGFYLGSIPGRRATGVLDEAKKDFQIRIGEFEARALEAETRRDLWHARGEFLAAALIYAASPRLRSRRTTCALLWSLRR